MCWQRAPGALPTWALCLRRDRRPGVRQWPEAFTLNSCPEMQPLPAHLCVIRVIKVIKSFGFASQLRCQLAEWPWASHMASGAQVAVVC